MLVTFKANASHPDVTMFGRAAHSLLRMMGQSGNVPGAILAEDIPAALEALKQALAEQGESGEVAPSANVTTDAGHPNVDDHGDDEDKVEPVPLSRRAMPLVRLLEAAHAANTSVRWEE